MNVLEDLKRQLEYDQLHMDEICERMQYDINTKDFSHLARISAEANEIKGKIEMLTRTIYMLEKSNAGSYVGV